MITLNNVVPIPIKDQVGQSTLWGQDFQFAPPKRYFVEAPSGKGKTTLQHILYGLRKDYTGKVLIEGKDIQSFDLEDWATIRQQRLSIIFQDLRLFLPLTGMENIQIKNQLTEHKTIEAITEMAKQLDVADLLNKKCGEMSFGQRQRIAIIRALCQPFDFLLMDEPFAHLDSQNIKRCCVLIGQEAAAQQAGFAIASLEERYQLEYDYEIKI